MEHTNFMMMIGVVASGKSTLAQKLKNMLTKMGQPTMIVSSAEIRETVFGDVNDQTHNDEVFKEVRRRINNCIDKMNIIVDATNINVITVHEILATERLKLRNILLKESLILLLNILISFIIVFSFLFITYYNTIFYSNNTFF